MKPKLAFLPAVIVGIIFFLLIGEQFGLGNFFYQPLNFVLKPARALVARVVQSGERLPLALLRIPGQARTVQMLESRYSEVLAQLTALEQLQKENAELKKLLQNTDRSTQKVVITTGVVSQIGPTIGAGEEQGVKVGNLVFVSQTLVGRVRQVFPGYSQIDLITDRDFAPVVAQTSDGHRGLVKGDGKHALLTEVISEGLPAAEARIVSVGQVGAPAGIFIGQVGKLLSTPADSTKTFQIISQVNFYEASVVEVYQ